MTDVSEVNTVSIIRAMMEAVRASETSVYSNDSTRRYIQKALIFILNPLFIELPCVFSHIKGKDPREVRFA
jgi:hypothetical protein